MDQNQQTNNAPQPGTPEYAQMMADKFQNQRNQSDPNQQSFQQPQSKPQRPSHVPEKFWDAEKGEVRTDALLKSYTELEKTRGQQPTQQQQQQSQQQAQPQDGAAQDAVNAAGLKWDDLGGKIASKGTIDEADYAALAKAGIPREVVDGYIGALKTANEAARAKTAEYVGGEPVLNHILQRASQEMEAEEIDSMNAMLRNPKTAKAALDVLKQRFAPADGEPLSVLGGGNGQPGLVGFGSQFEMTEAINKRNERGQKLYEVDPAYRAQVRQRIALTRK